MPMPPTIGHTVNFGKSLIGLIKQGFWEIPSVMCSTMCAFVGLGFGIAGLNRYNDKKGDNREYKKTYMIMRPTDPRVPLLRNPVYTKY
ncbi:unnamed protein product [Leptosia nina]|uniref:NADH dehydrogenase [ubiquinone] 1 alpha subcomplex subunit 1 n=1 Tax=Leptosia nina TaxID=320188 RepID=A0AAV1JGX7_9NEOP